MNSVDITRLSSKGQIVLPLGIREQMKLVEGARFVIMGTEDTIILKRLETLSREELQRLLKDSRTYARKARLKKQDVKSAIRKVRSRRVV